MTKELYDTLSYKEKMMYDELHQFCERLTLRMDEMIELLKTIIAVGEGE